MIRACALTRAGGLAIAALALATGRVHAQLAFTGELGAARYSDDPFGRGALSAAAAGLAYATDPIQLQLTGFLARLEGGGLGGGGAGNASLRLWRARRIDLRVNADAGAIRFTDYDPARYLSGSLQSTLEHGRFSTSLALQRGETFLGTSQRPIWSVHSRLNGIVGPFSSSVGFTGHRLRPPSFSFDVGGNARPAAWQQVGDASASLRWIGRRAELGVSALARFGDATLRGTSATVDAAYWISPQVAISASAGRQLDDLLRGIGRTRVATVALRFSTPSLQRGAPAPRPRPDQLRAERLPDGTVLLRVRLPDAAQLELSGDLTGWTPRAFVKREGDSWELSLGSVAAGVTRVQWRLNGGPWLPPPGLPTRPSDFDGMVGDLPIP